MLTMWEGGIGYVGVCLCVWKEKEKESGHIGATLWAEGTVEGSVLAVSPRSDREQTEKQANKKNDYGSVGLVLQSAGFEPSFHCYYTPKWMQLSSIWSEKLRTLILSNIPHMYTASCTGNVISFLSNESTIENSCLTIMLLFLRNFTVKGEQTGGHTSVVYFRPPEVEIVINSHVSHEKMEFIKGCVTLWRNPWKHEPVCHCLCDAQICHATETELCRRQMPAAC